jgi:glucan phosphoethanolaminetransferase (alkaline phosphatase superfamily)
MNRGCHLRIIPIRLLTAFLILCLPWLALGAWLARVKGFQSVTAFVASIAVMTLMMAILARTWRRFLLLQFPVLLLSATFAAYTFTYDSPPGEFIAFVLATSSWQDVRGFFGIWQGMGLMLAALTVALLYLYLAISSPHRTIESDLGRRVRWGLMAAIVMMSAYAGQNPAAFINGIALNPPIGMALFAAGPLRRAVAAVNGTAVRKEPFGTTRVNAEEVHVLVIGESARRDSWSVYGYQRDTTPSLKKLRDEAIFLRHAVADANYTARVVPILLTGMSPMGFDLSNVRGNIVDLAREAGYSTAWLMNQDPHVSLMAGIHADRMVYPPTVSTLVGGGLPLDGSLLPVLQREIERQGKRRFIGLHVIGSHWEYDTRYPPAFERFGSGKELNYLSVLSQKADQRILDAYDNSVLYTDWFLGQVIEQVRKLSSPATVTYFADHGEDLFLLDGNAGHGTSDYTRHQFDIPAFVWVNSAYRAAHPDKVQALTQNADKEIRSHNLFYSVADLMGIQWAAASPNESFASASFTPDSQTAHLAGDAMVSLSN